MNPYDNDDPDYLDKIIDSGQLDDVDPELLDKLLDAGRLEDLDDYLDHIIDSGQLDDLDEGNLTEYLTQRLNDAGQDLPRKLKKLRYDPNLENYDDVIHELNQNLDIDDDLLNNLADAGRHDIIIHLAQTSHLTPHQISQYLDKQDYKLSDAILDQHKQPAQDIILPNTRSENNHSVRAWDMQEKLQETTTYRRRFTTKQNGTPATRLKRDHHGDHLKTDPGNLIIDYETNYNNNNPKQHNYEYISIYEVTRSDDNNHHLKTRYQGDPKKLIDPKHPRLNYVIAQAQYHDKQGARPYYK